jgi:hypothetical protein
VSTAPWYADGLRWIGSLFHAAADHLERPALEPGPRPQPMEDFLSDVRLRIHSRYY